MSVAPYEPLFHVVLHQPEIPPNTGAIGRTCVALRAKLWLVRPLGFRVDEKTLRRAGLDYWQHLNWQVVDSWQHLQDEAKDVVGASLPETDGDGTAEARGGELERFWMFTKTATQIHWSVPFQQGDWLIFGSETSGLPPSLLTDAARNIRLPMAPEVRSLNLASAVAVAGYEVARQLEFPGKNGES